MPAPLDPPAAYPCIGYPGHELLLPDVVRAENCSLFDAHGRRWVDLESGVWCTAIGHGHPRLRQAITAQYDRIAHAGFGYSSGVVAEAAGGILSLLGFEGGRCVFLCSGSEAVEYGVRTAQSIVERPLLLATSDAYFGAYGSASRKAAEEWFAFDWSPCAGCRETEDCDGRCEHWAAVPWDAIGGFVFEPGSSSGLVRFPPPKPIRNIVAAVRESAGIVLINEVTTGIGRTGRWFGYQHYGIKPDIVALGKGIGNGYPVSVTALAPGVVDRLGGRPVKYAQSHQNDPLGAAVVREVVRTIEAEGLIERGRRDAGRLLAELEEIRSGTGRIREIRGRGPMIAIELEDDARTAATTRIHRELARRGYLVGRRPDVPVLRLDPSLTIDPKDIDGFLAAFRDVLTGGAGGLRGERRPVTAGVSTAVRHPERTAWTPT